jgi:histidine ammonia-lyase
MRLLLAGQQVRPARIQDPYGYRGLPQVHGPAADRPLDADIDAAERLLPELGAS